MRRPVEQGLCEIDIVKVEIVCRLPVLIIKRYPNVILADAGCAVSVFLQHFQQSRQSLRNHQVIRSERQPALVLRVSLVLRAIQMSESRRQ